MENHTAELMLTIDQLNKTFEDLCIRGLRSAGTDELNKLASIQEELDRIGAAHLCSRLEQVVQGIRNGSRNAAPALMQAQASLRLFERILTLEVAASQLQSLLGADATTYSDNESNDGVTDDDDDDDDDGAA